MNTKKYQNSLIFLLKKWAEEVTKITESLNILGSCPDHCDHCDSDTVCTDCHHGHYLINYNGGVYCTEHNNCPECEIFINNFWLGAWA